MSKYEPLWKWVGKNGSNRFELSFSEIENIAGFPIDHSFLNCKKELLEYGYKVNKISIKKQTIVFEKTDRDKEKLI